MTHENLIPTVKSSYHMANTLRNNREITQARVEAGFHAGFPVSQLTVFIRVQIGFQKYVHSYDLSTGTFH